MEIPLWDQEKQMEFLKDQLHYHSASPMDCPMEKRWQRQTSWAVWKTGNKRASKVCYKKEEADTFLKEKNLSYVEERPGSCIRCASYCNARSVCVDSPCFLGEKGDKHEF